MSARACEPDELAALVFGELDAADAERVNQHVASCRRCAGELAWLRAERRIVRERARAQPPLAESLWAGIAARLDGGAETGRERARPEAPSPVSWSWVRMKLRTRWVPIGLGAGLAATALVLLWTAAGGPGGTGTRPDERTRSAARPDIAHPVADPAARPAPSIDAKAGGAERAGTREDGLAAAERAVAEAERAHLAAIDALERVYAERRARLDPETAREHDQELSQARASYARERLSASGDLESRLLLLDAYSEHRRLLQLLVQELEARN